MTSVFANARRHLVRLIALAVRILPRPRFSDPAIGRVDAISYLNEGLGDKLLKVHSQRLLAQGAILLASAIDPGLLRRRESARAHLYTSSVQEPVLSSYHTASDQ